MSGEFLSNISPELIFQGDSDGVVTIGRNLQQMQGNQTGVPEGLPQAYFTVTDLTVSSVHCRFRRQSNFFYIEDLGSKNGTIVHSNGSDTVLNDSSSQIFAGDSIKIGASLELVLRVKNKKVVVEVIKHRVN